MPDEPLDQWENVDIDDNGRVIVLHLNSDELSGEIPPELGNLASLEWLGLDDNELSGCVLGKLQTQLTETPADLGGLPFC